MTKPQPAAGPGRHIPDNIEHFIGGRQVPSADGATFGVADPVSNQVYAHAAAGGAADIARAVVAAHAAFESDPWPTLASGTRAKILNKIADGIESRGARIAELETFDTGLPVTQANGQAARAAENFRYFADVIVAQHEEAFLPARAARLREAAAPRRCGSFRRKSSGR
jgi:5-carboxymethyl-2-hydroxymuconic-semialdehyde dehydrogenase